MQVKQRLQINTTISVITAFAVMVMLILALYRVNNALEAEDIAGNIITDVFERSTLEADYLRHNSERARVQWLAKHDHIGKVLSSASKKFRRDRQTIDDLIKDHEATGELFLSMQKIREETERGPGSDALLREMENRVLTQMTMSSYDTVLYASKLHETGRGYLFSTLRVTGGGIVCVIVVITAAVVINSWRINRIIASRFTRLQYGASIIGEGNLDHTIDIKGNDEFAELAASFNAMTAKLRSSYHDLEYEVDERKRAQEALRKANDELETRVAERTGELEESRSRLERQNEELQNTYENMKAKTAEQLQAMEELREKDRMMIQQSRMAAMGEMLGNIAHQWRQPLNILGLMIQDLIISYESGDFDKETLETTVGKAMGIVLHLSQTIDDFSSFATPEKEKNLFLVDQVIQKTISLVGDNFRRQGIAVEVETCADLQINGYSNEYAQVLLNILINARDALLERGRNDARITVRSWAERDRAVVTITDNGGGIPVQIIPKIFDPYFTTKALGKGTGVGLFMSKTIIEKKMAGHLSVRNVGDGAEFRIEV